MVFKLYLQLLSIIFLSGLFLFPLKSLASDTIVLNDNNKDYNLNLASKDSIIKSSGLETIIYLKNNSSQEKWFFKCDSWGEVILDSGDSIFIGGWDLPYKQTNFIFSRENRCPVIPLLLESGKVYRFKVSLSSPVLRAYRTYYNCGVVQSETIGNLSSFQTVLTNGLIIILIVFAIYNFFLFFITKDKSFIKYSITHLLFSVLWFNTIGVTVYFFEFDLLYLRLLDSVFATAYMTSYFWFSRGYLGTKKTDPRMDRFLIAYQYSLIFITIAFCLLSVIKVDHLDYVFSTLMLYLLSPVGVILLIISIIRAILRKNKLVVYFSFAMLAFIATIVIINSILIGDNSKNIFVLNSVLFGAVLEAILFSLGLAAKIKVSQNESKVAQQNLLEQLKENQKIKDEFSRGLEKKVEERTLELKQKNNIIVLALKDKEVLIKEVHHRVKNNLQLMYSFMSLQSNRTQNQLIKEAISESKERIRTLTMIHNNLSFSDHTEEVNIKDYIPDIASHLSSLSVHKILKPIVNVDSVFLPVKKAVSLGLIVNEIITNAIKYAEVSREFKHIYITALKKEKHLELVIYDDGIGQLDSEMDSNSLGMLIIKDLSKQLKAKLKVEKDFKYVITIPID